MKLWLLFITVFGLCFLNCVSVKPMYFDDDKKRAVKAIEEYHEQFNRAAYHEIFLSSHPDAQANKSESKLVDVLSQMRDVLGNVVSSQLVHANVSIANAKERQVEMLYRTQFEKGERNEAFLVVTDENRGRLHTLAMPTDEEVKSLADTQPPKPR